MHVSVCVRVRVCVIVRVCVLYHLVSCTWLIQFRSRTRPQTLTHIIDNSCWIGTRVLLALKSGVLSVTWLIQFRSRTHPYTLTHIIDSSMSELCKCGALKCAFSASVRPSNAASYMKWITQFNPRTTPHAANARPSIRRHRWHVTHTIPLTNHSPYILSFFRTLIHMIYSSC